MRFLVAALTLCALIGLAAPGAQASSSVRFGIQDDSWLVHGAGTLDERLDKLESLGVDVVRFNLHWDRIEPVRGKQNWEESDLVLEGLQDRGIPAVVGLVGSPRWANGGRTPNFAPGAAAFARIRAHGGEPLQLGQPVARLERAEPGAMASPDDTGGLRSPASESRLQGDSRSEPAGQGWWRRHGPARLDGRRVAGELDSRHAQGRCPSGCLRAPSLSVEQPRVAVRQRQLQVLHHDHDGHPRAVALGGEARLRLEADLADGVRRTRRARTASPSSARRS